MKRAQKSKQTTGSRTPKKDSSKDHKYIFVIGGVMSGVGKGIATSSISLILKSKGYRVNTAKVDPYLNVDAGTMNPTEHGEVFVLESGLETDQDLGNYERFLNCPLAPYDYMTGGMVYESVLDRERNLGYKGKCVEAIPHVRDEILDRYKKAGASNDSDISVIEIGGTVGDFQNALFIDAARVLKVRNPENVMFVLVSYLPVPGTLGEMKTKPTQNAVRQLNGYGVQPDMIIARSRARLDQKRKEKIAEQCNIQSEYVLSAPDISSIYDVPINFDKEQVGSVVLKKLGLKDNATNLDDWKKFVSKVKNAKKEVNIAIVGKYFDTGDFVLTDAYISVIEAIKFASAYNNAKPNITWVNAKDFEKDPKAVSLLKKYDGVIVPGGFGETGIEGKILAVEYARKNKIPYFGLCYGMHMLVIEYARHIAGLKDAHTVEINPKTKHPVIDVMPEQKELLKEEKYGGTMRLGSYPAKLKKGSVVEKAYGTSNISERHRHRYEVNPEYIDELEKAGLVFSGKSPDEVLMEIAELPKSEHPFFVGVQFHPEFQARPLDSHPLFDAFIKASLNRKQ